MLAPARPAIYLDANAGAPLLPQVKDALRSFLDQSILANPASLHTAGRQSRQVIAQAESEVLSALQLNTRQGQKLRYTAHFAGSGTEVNQWVIRSALQEALDKRVGNLPVVWITTPVEHASVLSLAEWFRGAGGVVEFLPVDDQGLPSWEACASHFHQLASLSCSTREGNAVGTQPALLSLIWVNNETGVITPIAEWRRRLAALATPQMPRIHTRLHVDIAQGVTKVGALYGEWDADYLTFSGHKFGALAGVGGVVAKSSAYLSPRTGTPNGAGILSLGTALKHQVGVEHWEQRVRPLRDELEANILAQIPGVRVTGRNSPRVANTLHFGIADISNSTLLMRLDLAGFAVSTGSACASGSVEPSHVLLAMGWSVDQARTALRVSLPSEVQREELAAFVKTLENEVQRIRQCRSSRIPQNEFWSR